MSECVVGDAELVLMENGSEVVPWGLCSGPEDRELPSLPHALGGCVILWSFGKVLLCGFPQASGASTSSSVVVPIGGH